MGFNVPKLRGFVAPCKLPVAINCDPLRGWKAAPPMQADA